MSTFWWLFGLVLVLVIGQILMLRPTRRDRELLRLREAARETGLHPALAPPPAWLRPASKEFVAFYTLGVPNANLPYWRAEHQADGAWRTVSGPDLLAGKAVPDAARHLLAVEGQGDTVGFYWREEAGVEVLPALKSWLRTLPPS